MTSGGTGTDQDRGAAAREATRHLRAGYPTIFKLAAFACVAFLVYATLVPLRMRPSLDELGANYERLAAFAVAATLAALGWPHRRWRVAICLVLVAIALEFAQFAAFDRDARVRDALIKIAGVPIGIGLAALSESAAVAAIALFRRQRRSRASRVLDDRLPG